MNKEDFEVLAYFYNDKGFKYRRYLEIRRIGTFQTENDLNVIMMNPGSSKPKEINEQITDDFLNKFVIAHPDPTQYQIMRVMDNCNLNFAKIVNLSDIRNGSSNSFYKMLANELKEINHSIFNEQNSQFLINYLNPKSIFILGWGVNKNLNNLSKLAVDKIEKIFGKDLKLCGLNHPKNAYGYYHPLPRTKKQQIDWVNKITEQIKSYD